MSPLIRAQVTAMCARLGADPRLVQGAGGNASWKDENTLFIKASGTWLADAEREDIFVPVDLVHLRGALEAKDFSAAPETLPGAHLRPSIETVLHALMPQAVVLHVHAVEVLAYLVREDWQSSITARMPADIAVAYVPYRKPGSELAAAVAQALERGTVPVQVVMLQNHGVVVGGDSVDAVTDLLERVVAALREVPRSSLTPASLPALTRSDSGYRPFPNLPVHALAITPAFWLRVQNDWALYPDHVVFLGAQAHCFVNEDALAAALQTADGAPELVIVQDLGVFMQDSFGLAKQEQLQCYYDVISRQDTATSLRSLSLEEVAVLLNWESEKYRMKLAK